MTTSSVLILGSGIAGLSTALKFAAQKIHCTVVCKQDLAEGATRYAQGGIASVWSKTDSFNEHIRDTLTAGAGLCKTQAVELCVREGPKQVQELIDLGVQFTKHSQTFDLHQEGGHGKRRILHAGDLTGYEIERALIEKAKNNEWIKILEYHTAIDLITDQQTKLSPAASRKTGRVIGVYLLENKTGKILAVSADLTVLATGGAGKVYLYTSNPNTATGDGIAMAYRAGARVANLEFMQFHPTCLYHPAERTFLISEALRGEGALLKNQKGQAFMKNYHEALELAPRDIVARAIDQEMKRTGDTHVFLDLTHLDPIQTQTKFPNIYATCLRLGINITKDFIPVVPAVHYTCGGVLTDFNGQTTLEGLYAVGEVACTGVHGANRLASNSLLEAVVFADRVVQKGSTWLKENKIKTQSQRLPPWEFGTAVPLEQQIDLASNWLEIRTLMWNYVGIVRSDRRLDRARRRLDLIREDVHRAYWNYLLTQDLIELRNLVLVADLIIQCAWSRKESRGLHYTLDYPETDDTLFKHDTVL